MARRLRSNAGQPLLEVETPELTPAAAAPPKKKQKTEPVRYECVSCSTNRLAKFFPNVNPSSDCDHMINTCTTCLKKWVEMRVTDGQIEHGKEDGKAGIRCPECPELMREINVQHATTRKVLQRFQELERRHIANTVPGWRWCLDSKCKAGQVHEKTEKKPVTTTKKTTTKGVKKSKKQKEMEAEAEKDICVCHECGHKACVPCDRPDHSPETCADYQRRIKGRTDEEDKSKAMLLKISKPCPSCKKPIQKAGGCNSMICSACRTNFCWECLEVFTNRGCECTRAAIAAHQARLIAAGLPPDAGLGPGPW